MQAESLTQTGLHTWRWGQLRPPSPRRTGTDNLPMKLDGPASIWQSQRQEPGRRCCGGGGARLLLRGSPPNGVSSKPSAIHVQAQRPAGSRSCTQPMTADGASRGSIILIVNLKLMRGITGDAVPETGLGRQGEVCDVYLATPAVAAGATQQTPPDGVETDFDLWGRHGDAWQVPGREVGQ